MASRGCLLRAGRAPARLLVFVALCARPADGLTSALAHVVRAFSAPVAERRSQPLREEEGHDGRPALAVEGGPKGSAPAPEPRRAAPPRPAAAAPAPPAALVAAHSSWKLPPGPQEEPHRVEPPHPAAGPAAQAARVAAHGSWRLPQGTEEAPQAPTPTWRPARARGALGLPFSPDDDPGSMGRAVYGAWQSVGASMRDFWAAVAQEQKRTAQGESVRPDPIGICIGFSAVAFAAYSVHRSKREANRIISLFEANTQIKELEEKARRGEPLPNIVVIRGHIGADGRDVSTVTPRIEGLKDKVGEIEQPKNAWIEIARQAKRDPQLKGIADAVVERTGVDAADVPDVPEPGENYARESASKGEGQLVLSEILVARICAKHQRRDDKKKPVLIKRPCRNESYNCFHGRRVAEGLHLVDLDGTRADLDLPPADAVGLAGIPEPPPLFLPVNDVWTEFTHYLRRDGLTGPGGRHQRLDDLPPMRLSDPYTLLSEFIFIDVQSPGDLGGFPGNGDVLGAIAESYRGKDGPAKFLWEPRGFYDSVKGGGYDDVPAYASARFRRTEMVSAQELTERAQAAARQNALNTPYCEPTFTREELIQRRDAENCFRYTELAIPRGSAVTVLARPMVAEAGTGEGAECRIRLTSPVGVAEDGSGDPRADRFRFRIRPGHTVENLLRLRDLNVNAYYGLALVGLAFAGWAAAGYPGMGAG